MSKFDELRTALRAALAEEEAGIASARDKLELRCKVIAFLSVGILPSDEESQWMWMRASVLAWQMGEGEFTRD